MSHARPTALGLDFGTTNSVAALARGGAADLVLLDAPDGPDAVFRSALCFWQDDAVPGGVASEAGPWAIAEYLEYPEGSRFLQSFKSVAASSAFEQATVFDRRYRFEDLGRLFLDKLAARAGGAFGGIGRVIVGRPVEYAGHRPDEALARTRYDAMFAALGAEIHYVYEPVGAAFSYAARIEDPATILVADFGGGTSDFSVVRIAAPGAERRCEPLGHAGVGIAGDRFDYRILDHLVLPLLGKGSSYRSFDKVLEIPRGYFTDFADWSRLALMRNRRTLAELDKLRRSALDPDAVGRMIAVIEEEQGFRLYDAVGRVKRDLSAAESASFRFAGGGLSIEAEVTRAQFEAWIAPDVARIEAAVDAALAAAAVPPTAIDRVFLTGGTSLTPRIRRLFTERFGEEKIASGGELTSIAHGLALIGEQEDVAAWAV
ncbi:MULTISPECIES: Hsp70 family protein [Sphingomonas]|uniref:Hsp70 family protein n=1 Tax=Sphingomonas TaxID=13687 RepID=UPI000F7EFC71|nr:Hsp70 family protein [Sphingomonas sp. ABOLF]RSV15444.1 Hsp70 family protein [Sphingomonas sp. ABOLF]GLK22391.1 molecular chaperone DnaK [Microbacterium terregens]